MIKLKILFTILFVLVMPCASKWQCINQLNISSLLKNDSQIQNSCCQATNDCNEAIVNPETILCMFCQLDDIPVRLISAYQLKLPAKSSSNLDSIFDYQKSTKSYFHMNSFLTINIKFNPAPYLQDLIPRHYLKTIHTTVLLI